MPANCPSSGRSFLEWQPLLSLTPHLWWGPSGDHTSCPHLRHLHVAVALALGPAVSCEKSYTTSWGSSATRATVRLPRSRGQHDGARACQECDAVVVDPGMISPSPWSTLMRAHDTTRATPAHDRNSSPPSLASAAAGH